MKNILVVVAHSDDETLGMGATIAYHSAQGDDVRLIVMTDGVSARNAQQTTKAEAERQLSLKQATKTLGISKIYSHQFPGNQMDSVPLLTIAQ
ncbi:MAG: GlcNAc-PI de-N-acetylase, partial [Flavobacteriaceae bacterium]